MQIKCFFYIFWAQSQKKYSDIGISTPVFHMFIVHISRVYPLCLEGLNFHEQVYQEKAVLRVLCS